MVRMLRSPEENKTFVGVYLVINFCALVLTLCPERREFSPVFVVK